MSRTTFGQTAPVDVTTLAANPSRTTREGLVAGNYVTFRLLNKTATVANDSRVLKARIPFLQPFRVSRITFDALGLTAGVTAFVDNSSTSDGITSSVVSSGMPAAITTGSLSTALFSTDSTRHVRDIAKGGTLDLTVTADGTGAAPAGSIVVWVTGYFLDHITNRMPWAVRGQTRTQSPVAGFYDCLSLINLRANAAQAARSECDILAPYPGRVEAVIFDGRNMTITTGTITVDIQKNAVSTLSAAFDADANAQNASFIVDNDSTPNLVADSGGTPPTVTPRTFVRGDTLSLVIASGAADVVPIDALAAHLIVWCQGHARDVNAEPTVED